MKNKESDYFHCSVARFHYTIISAPYLLFYPFQQVKKKKKFFLSRQTTTTIRKNANMKRICHLIVCTHLFQIIFRHFFVVYVYFLICVCAEEGRSKCKFLCLTTITLRNKAYQQSSMLVKVLISIRLFFCSYHIRTIVFKSQAACIFCMVMSNSVYFLRIFFFHFLNEIAKILLPCKK